MLEKLWYKRQMELGIRGKWKFNASLQSYMAVAEANIALNYIYRKRNVLFLLSPRVFHGPTHLGP